YSKAVFCTSCYDPKLNLPSQIVCYILCWCNHTRAVAECADLLVLITWAATPICIGVFFIFLFKTFKKLSSIDIETKTFKLYCDIVHLLRDD
ncbi:hypothetical protein ALC53_09002, partial [Atta colombica]